MVTIKEIAQRAGVSTATVSYVIHGKLNKVSAETVERVRTLMDEMGYAPAASLAPTARQRGCLLAAVVIHTHYWFENSVLTDPFYGMVMGSIEEELRRQGVGVMLYASQNAEEALQTILDWGADGVIAVSFSMEECGKLSQYLRKPIISIDAYGKPGECCPVPNVGLDDEEGGYLMTRHLFELGYESVFLCGASNTGIDHQRWLGAQRGARLEQFSAGNLDFLQLGYTRAVREANYEDIARQVPFRKRTAFFFTSDAFAMEAARYLNERGVRIPQDVGVAGFDNTFLAVNFSIPRLTTISQDIRQKGLLAARELVTALRDADYQPKNYILPVALVPRQSV